jgi:DNA polymerase III subunit gamma/tau
MENFIVSARKYRPDTFNSVVGQNSITATLKNAIKNNHLGHAYLFSGPRGVGKTTCARIFAKTINCQNLSDNVEACNECESCTSFNESRAYNIHELDAASNNSVDDIRSLTEQVRIPPQVGAYSLYIIDEVHMLSQQAFNAFLKTLEEPPKHAIFILATTEKHKIIPTILSRCQIFDFNRIKTEDAVEYLKFISREEKITAEEEGLHVIAQKSEGAMRDALSIFDQVVSFSGDNITYASVIENLNILDIEYYFNLTNAFLKCDISSALLAFNEILEKGFDARNFVNGLASHLRDLMVCKDPGTAVLLDVGTALTERYLTQSKEVPLDFLYRGLEVCNDADIQFRNSRNQRLTIELALVKLSNLSRVEKKKVTKPASDTAETSSTPTQETSTKDLPESDTGTTESTSNELSTSGDRSPVQKTSEIDTTATDTNEEAGEKSKARDAQSTTPVDKNDTSPRREHTNETANGNGRNNKVVHAKSISIKDSLKGEGPKEEEEVSQPSDQSKFAAEKPAKTSSPEKELILSNELIVKSWNDYADSIKESQPRIYNTLKQCQPSLDSAGIIQVVLTSHAQKDNFLLRIKPELVRYFRENLKNIEYTIESSVTSNGGVQKKVYTDEDKMNFLLKKNPIMEKFKNSFKLDFDD